MSITAADIRREVKEKNLHEQRRPTKELHIDLREHTQHAQIRDARHTHDQTDHKADCRRQYRDLYRDPRADEQQRE